MRKLRIFADDGLERNVVGLRLAVAREHGLRSGEPVDLRAPWDDRLRRRLAGWCEVDESEIGPDGCLVHPAELEELRRSFEDPYVVVESGRRPMPAFYALTWTVDEPRAERRAEDLLVIVDTSASMEGTPLRHARRALHGFVDRKRELGLDDRLGLVTFGGRGAAGVRVAARPSEAGESHEGFVRAVRRLRVGGLTPMAEALERAREVFSELMPRHADPDSSPRRRRLILVSDGHPCPGSPDEVLAVADTLAAEKVYVATVGVGEHFHRPLLAAVAARTGAHFVEAHRIRHLPALLETLA